MENSIYKCIYKCYDIFMVTLNLHRPPSDIYKVIVNGHRIKMTKSDSEDCLGNKCCSIDLPIEKTMNIVIKRTFFSCVLCFFVNILGIIALLGKESGMEQVRNNICFIVENTSESDGEIKVRINKGNFNKNHIAVSDALVLNIIKNE